jgi:hypothetical protein
MRFRLFVLATLLACALTLIPTAAAAGAETGSATATNSVLHPNGPEAFAHVTRLTPEQHEMLDEKLEKLHDEMVLRKGPLPPGPQVPVLSNQRETRVVNASDESKEPLPSPGALYMGINKPYSIVGDGESTTAEPAITQSGQKWFVTQNWSRGYSTDHGLAFTGVPDDTGPTDAPFFCCDQDAVHDHGRDVSIWEELFVDSALSTGVIRIHVLDAAGTGDACTYDLNGGSGVLFDYPHLGLGNNFIYITANGITNGGWSGAIVWRYNLDQMATCQSINGSVFTWTGSVGQVVWTPARGTTDTMFLVTVENGSQNRYFWWPENSNSIFWTVVNVESSSFTPATCTGGKSGNNWLGFGLSTSPIGFSLRSAVGYDGSASSPPVQYLATYYSVNANGSNRPQAYVAGAIVQVSDMTFLNGADIFSGGSCFSYADVTANSRGDLGLVVGLGSSSSGGGPAESYVGISDDYSRGSERGYFQSVSLCAGANDNPTRWGDYLTARVQEPVDVAFTAAAFGDVTGAGKVHICEFMRGRYAQAYLDRRFK